MVYAQKAINEAQRVNRNNWLKAAGNRISDMVMNEARTGKRFVNICLNEFIVGAENLEEAAEMLDMLCDDLKEHNFGHKITPDGELYITW